MRQHDALGPGVAAPLDDGFQVVQSAQHRHAVDRAADARSLVVDDADDLVAGLAVAGFLPDEGFRRVVCPDEQHRDAPVLAVLQKTLGAAVLEHAVGEARSAQQRHQDEPVDEGHRAREQLEPREQEQQRQEDQDRERDGLGDRDEVVERRVAPDAPVHLAEAEDEGGGHGEKDRARQKIILRFQQRAVAEPEIDR